MFHVKQWEKMMIRRLFVLGFVALLVLSAFVPGQCDTLLCAEIREGQR